jgi:hypothetical protein
METIRLFIQIVNVTHDEIEIEWKCCHGNSNHELKVNAVILIQIIKQVDTLFLRNIHFFELVPIVYMFFVLLYIIPNHMNRQNARL